MGLFESLLTGGQRGQQGARPQAQQAQQRQEFDDFIGRYEQGPPWAGVSDQEALERYQQVVPHVSPEVYEQSAQEAYARMSPQERAQFGQYLRQQARQQNIDIPDFNQDGIDDRLQDPATLARVTSRMHQQQPGVFGQILGGGAGRGGSGGGAMDPATLQAIQIRSAYEADKNTPTDQWLRARGMTQAQLDAALSLAERADPRGSGARAGGASAGAGPDMAGMLANPLAKAALAGIAAMAAKRMLSGR